MKTTILCQTKVPGLLLATCLVIGAEPSGAAHREQPANPRGAAGVGTAGPGTAGPGAPGRGAAGPGTAGPVTPGPGTAGRGAAGPGTAGRGTAGVGAPGRGAAGPGYVHTLPAGYERRAYNNLNYYYADGIYYYGYPNDGATLYVPATIVNGVPTVPPRPYVYSLPTGYTIESYGGVNYYKYYSFYYYVYYINGRAVYVLATVVDGVPTVPPPPY